VFVSVSQEAIEAMQYSFYYFVFCVVKVRASYFLASAAPGVKPLCLFLLVISLIVQSDTICDCLTVDDRISCMRTGLVKLAMSTYRFLF